MGTGPTPGRGQERHRPGLASTLVLSPNAVTHPDQEVVWQYWIQLCILQCWWYNVRISMDHEFHNLILYLFKYIRRLKENKGSILNPMDLEGPWMSQQQSFGLGMWLWIWESLWLMAKTWSDVVQISKSTLTSYGPLTKGESPMWLSMLYLQPHSLPSLSLSPSQASSIHYGMQP